MNLLKIVFVLGAAAFTIGATYLDTNARRMARGLPPLPPVRRATPVAGAKRSLPSDSGSNDRCNKGYVRCCSSVYTFNHYDDTKDLSERLGFPVPVHTPVGIDCLTLAGTERCQQKTVCCDSNQNDNFISVGCIPLDIL